MTFSKKKKQIKKNIFYIFFNKKSNQYANKNIKVVKYMINKIQKKMNHIKFLSKIRETPFNL
jgi:hypothetical protein